MPQVQQHSPRGSIHLTGPTIVRMMRKHRRTIRGLAASMRITQKRVREARAQGVHEWTGVWDWLEAITQESWTKAEVCGPRAAAYVASLYCHPPRRIPPVTQA